MRQNYYIAPRRNQPASGIRIELASIVLDALFDSTPYEQVLARLKAEARNPDEYAAAVRKLNAAIGGPIL